MRTGGGNISLSISGYERNHLFLSRRGQQFADISGISGLDALGDGRAFALLDYDRDGWQDVAVVNINAPLLNLYHNDIGRLADADDAPGVIALRFVGGNHSPQPSDSYGARDGYGAVVTVSAKEDETAIVREHRCGEGLAAQNSATMLVGIGSRRVVDSVVVRWPSGVTQHTSGVEAGTLLTVFENPDHSPSGGAFVAQPYVPPLSPPPDRFIADAKPIRVPFASGSAEAVGAAEPTLRMFTSTATWCAACKTSLPQLRLLRESFAAHDLEMSGIPIDPTDGPGKLDAYVSKHEPAYRLRTDLTSEQVSVFSDIVLEVTGLDALPSTLITDTDGGLLLATGGVPTVSQLRKLLLYSREAEIFKWRHLTRELKTPAENYPFDPEKT